MKEQPTPKGSERYRTRDSNPHDRERSPDFESDAPAPRPFRIDCFNAFHRRQIGASAQPLGVSDPSAPQSAGVGKIRLAAPVCQCCAFSFEVVVELRASSSIWGSPYCLKCAFWLMDLAPNRWRTDHNLALWEAGCSRLLGSSDLHWTQSDEGQAQWLANAIADSLGGNEWGAISLRKVVAQAKSEQSTTVRTNPLGMRSSG